MSIEWWVAVVVLVVGAAVLGWFQLRDASARYRWLTTGRQPRRGRRREGFTDPDDESPR